MDPEISILVLTHNQRHLLERCLDSILKQQIRVPYEIIVADDMSTDGTEEYVKSLSNSNQVSDIKTLLGVFYIRSNPDDSSLITQGRRIGWNRLTAYEQSRGKYFVNVDADDFLIGTDLYQSEYEMLERFPDCSMVQTRTLQLDEGADVCEVRECYPFSDKLDNGRVFSLDQVLLYGLRGQHQSYMYRRRPQDDMRKLLGYNFDDINITYYHLQFAPVVFLDVNGYVWVQHPRSDSHGFINDDALILYGLIPLRLAMLFPESKYVFLKYGVKKLWSTVAIAPKYPELSERVRKPYSASSVFIYRFFAEKKHSVFSWVRYYFIYYLLLLMKRLQSESRCSLDLLFNSMV